MSTKNPSFSSTKQAYDAMAKVAVIGDSSVGKTNILLRFVSSEYQMTHITTIGIDFKVKTIAIDGFRIKMQIWDTAGQQRFRNLSGTIYQGAQAIILVYSINSRKTFDDVEVWIQDISNKTKGHTLLAIVGNKCDLEQEREVSKQEGQQIAKKHGAKIFFQTSAKDGINIEQLFESVGRHIKQKIIPKKLENFDNKIVEKQRSKTIPTGNRPNDANNMKATKPANHEKITLTVSGAEKKKKKCEC